MASNRTRHGALLAAALAIGGTGSATAPAIAQGMNAASLHAGTLEVPLNKSQVVSTDSPIARAMVGNADIADVLPITDRSIYVLGKKMGTTSLTLYDRLGRVITIMDIAVGPDVIALGEQLRQLVPGEKIEARISNEAVVLTGTVNSAGAADRAAQLAKAYAGDKVINLISMGSSQQVMLEVRFAEVSRSTGKDIGVKLGARSRDGTFNGLSGAGSQFTPGQTSSTNTSTNGVAGSLDLLGSVTNTDGVISRIGSIVGAGNISGSQSATTNVLSDIFKMGAVSSGFGIFSKQFSIGDVNFNAVIDAMETQGMAKTLAQPTLIALSGEKASFLAGGEFPIPVAQGTGGGNGGNATITVEFKPFGVSLGFTPTVLGDKTISLVVEPEVSAIDPSASITIGGISIPGLRTRRASTTLELRDGESFAIAGLISKDFQTTVNQIPLLGSIPLLGALFRSSSFQKGETELLIVVTPRLVAPIRPGQVRLPTDRVLDPRELDTFLLGQPYRASPVEPAAPNSPQSNAAPAAPTALQAATAVQTPKDDRYAF